MKTGKLKHLLVLLVIAGTALAIAYLVKSKPEAPTKPEQETAWSVDVQTLEYSQQSPELNILGSVESVQNTLITSRVNTTVTSTPVLAGTAVKQGEIILHLDQLEVGVALTQRQADVSELEALIAEQNIIQESNLQSLQTEKNLLKLAEKALARQQRLVKNNVTSKERVENSEVALQQQKLALTNRQLSVNNHQNRINQLQARLSRAKAQLTLAELDMAQTKLKAPFDGWVVSVSVAAGNRVRAGDPLIGLVARDSLEVKAQIPNRWVPDIQAIIANENAAGKAPGTTAYANVFNQRTELQLDRLAANASAATGGINAFFRPKEGNHLLLGKAVSLQVTLPPIAQAYSLPVSALYGDKRIYWVDEDSRLQAARIQRLGRYRGSDGKDWIIFSGTDLRPGMQVITTQLPNAVSGLKVNIRQ